MPMSPRLLRPQATGFTPTDADARAYVTAVQSADGQRLEPAVAKAIDDFVIGCKADGIWSAIKASCILMGARTLSGALTPLAGTAPTNFNFVSGDYSRKTGLIGNGATKCLDSNRAANADGQNNCHLSVWKSDSAYVPNEFFIGAYYDTNFASSVIGPEYVFCNEDIGSNTFSSAIGLHAHSRASSSSYTYKRPQTSVLTSTITSLQPDSTKHYVFAFGISGLAFQHCNSRLAFYSIGSSLSIALLNNRFTTLYNAIGAAIP